MSDFFDMAAQIRDIPYTQALLMYNLGFEIQVEAQQGSKNITTIMNENSIEQENLENRLVQMGILDEHLQPVKDAKYYANQNTLKHCGLHTEYKSGERPTIEYGSFEEICARLLQINRQHAGAGKYVSNGVVYVTI